jgi:hypothetical protein
VRIKEGASAEDHEEHRESVRLEVHQGNGIVSRSIERFQNRTLEIASGDRINPSTFRSPKRSILTGNKDSQPRCICIVKIRQSDGLSAERDILGKVGNHMRTIGDRERKRIDEFEDFVGQAQILGVLDCVDIA